MKFKEIMWKYQKYGSFTIIFIFLSIVLLVFLIGPIINILFQENIFTIWSTLMKDYVIEAIINSFICSFLSTFLGLILGIPMAYILAKFSFFGKNFIDSIIDIPILIPHSVAGIILLTAYGQNGIFGQFFNSIGIKFFDTYWGIIIGMFFVSVPFLIKGARDTFEMVNPNIEKAARTLGASRIKTFIDIHLGLTWRGILSSAILCWARGLSEFGAVYILASIPITGPVLVYFQFESEGLSSALPTSIALLLISFCIFIILRLIQGPINKKKRKG
ncbi:MAG: ABC transporter permease [Candidatus Helarchaeota archaeon]